MEVHYFNWKGNCPHLFWELLLSWIVREWENWGFAMASCRDCLSSLQDFLAYWTEIWGSLLSSGVLGSSVPSAQPRPWALLNFSAVFGTGIAALPLETAWRSTKNLFFGRVKTQRGWDSPSFLSWQAAPTELQPCPHWDKQSSSSRLPLQHSEHLWWPSQRVQAQLQVTFPNQTPEELLGLNLSEAIRSWNCSPQPQRPQLFQIMPHKFSKVTQECSLEFILATLIVT